MRLQRHICGGARIKPPDSVLCVPDAKKVIETIQSKEISRVCPLFWISHFLKDSYIIENTDKKYSNLLFAGLKETKSTKSKQLHKYN